MRNEEIFIKIYSILKIECIFSTLKIYPDYIRT